ncbi:hypothetical protein B0H13DRAFT_1897560 [Mycena leptocephala]|nr:hypothetical protein B0H13DRAFT_1897560 [Mycena leptocephala]
MTTALRSLLPPTSPSTSPHSGPPAAQRLRLDLTQQTLFNISYLSSFLNTETLTTQSASQDSHQELSGRFYLNRYISATELGDLTFFCVYLLSRFQRSTDHPGMSETSSRRRRWPLVHPSTQMEEASGSMHASLQDDRALAPYLGSSSLTLASQPSGVCQWTRSRIHGQKGDAEYAVYRARAPGGSSRDTSAVCARKCQSPVSISDASAATQERHELSGNIKATDSSAAMRQEESGPVKAVDTSAATLLARHVCQEPEVLTAEGELRWGQLPAVDKNALREVLALVVGIEQAETHAVLEPVFSWSNEWTTVHKAGRRVEGGKEPYKYGLTVERQFFLEWFDSESDRLEGLVPGQGMEGGSSKITVGAVIVEVDSNGNEIRPEAARSRSLSPVPSVKHRRSGASSGRAGPSGPKGKGVDPGERGPSTDFSDWLGRMACAA